jgi:HAE1 family hydrophobic/amphiphilic exporter-1
MLPVSDLPNVDFPTIQVTAALPGASPETVASAVATPLERQFSTIAGIDSMSSTSILGSCVITLQFNLSRNIDAAAQDVQASISQAARQLPQDMPSPPSYQKVNPADQPILYIALTSPTLPLSVLDEYGETMMAQRISTVSGVAQVQVYGAQKYAVRVQLDPEQLAFRGIGIDEAAEAVQAGNVNLPTGVLYGAHRAFTIFTRGQLTEASAYRPLIVAYRNGSPVRLSEIGRVVDSVENDKTAAWYGTSTREERAIVLAVQRQPGTNTVEVADAVKNLLPVFRKQLPPSVSLEMLYDRSLPINDSARDVQFTLWLTLGLVVAVIFLFLRSVRATIIPSMSLPMAIIGTFPVMYLLNYSLDNLSLMALTLSVGFVVDDAIVILENIFRHMEMGKSRLQAALDGSKEISFTIVSMTLSLATVFLPVVFMPGIVGRLFREFAVTIGVAVLVSGVIALTLIPMLASRFLRAEHEVKHGAFYRVTESTIRALTDLYGYTLRFVLNHRFATMIVSLGILVGTGFLFTAVRTGFLPSEDRGMIFGFTEGAEGISYRSLMEHQRAISRILQQDENIESFMSSAGGRGGMGASNSGFVFLRLKPRDQRPLSADQLVESLRAKLARVPGMKVTLQNPGAITVGGRMTKSLYQFTLQGPDIQELYKSALELEDAIRKIDGVVDVASDLQIKNPQVNLQIDRDKASSLGVSAGQIENALYTAYGSRQISTIYAPNNQYQVIMELLPQYQIDPDSLSMLYVRSSKGMLLPLKAVASLDIGVGPLSINHSGQLPSVTISFNLKPEKALGDAVNEINRLAMHIVPATVSTSFQGTAQAFQSSQQGMGVLLLMAILVIYMVLGILYESFIHPITILSALPFAGFGALLTLLIFNVELSLYAFVGIIMLVGLVKKNGIMMIDFALEAQRTGKSARDAIYEACIVRFRPITMTTLCALMAGIPLAVGYGAGGESRRPLGLAIVGGLLFSQSLTLYVTPVFFLYMEKFRTWISRQKKSQAAVTQGK